MRVHFALAAVLMLLGAIAAPAEAQPGTCELVDSRNARLEGKEPNAIGYISGPLLVTCSAGERLRADSAVIYQAQSEVQLFGRVDYQDPARSLTSDNATYNSRSGRLYATGNVVFTDRVRGSTLRGPDLEYFRAMEGRPEAQTIAIQRPHLTLVPRTEPGRPRRDPLEVDADRITTIGERHMAAEGNVVIRGKDLDSSGNQATYDATLERLELRQNARVRNPRFDLSGEIIESDLREGRIDRVLAQNDARLTSERLSVRGPQIRLFFADDLLQRLTSSGPVQAGGAGPRPIASAKGFRLQADSLDALLPAQELRQVIAVGTARGEAWDTVAAPRAAAGGNATSTAADSLPPSGIGEHDLILADTIIGYFARPDSAAPRPAGADTSAADTELERMLATGNAKSLYRVREEGAAATAPSISYLTGRQIDLNFAAGEVSSAFVRGLERGLYLDPAAAGADTARAPRGGAAASPAGRAPAERAPSRAPLGTPVPANREPQPVVPPRPEPSGGGRP